MKMAEKQTAHVIDASRTYPFQNTKQRDEVLSTLTQHLEASKENGFVVFGTIVEVYPEEGGTEAINVELTGFEPTNIIIGREQVLGWM
ncbi:hypothetical protein [Bacillus thuringiensis]|uniref:hypothetical protein n=1 Tax=Bacillus thuringiensis TaxID=1428 RepID=UPI000BFBF037|nr:hypothetical protein [Bacillus thuringiensis]PGT89989.1 hypothetical protein COD17_09575 [Bacillus thuringiensis]